MALKLLEIPLNNAGTSQEAASILQQFFESTFKDKSSGQRVNPTGKTKPTKALGQTGAKTDV